MIVKVVHDDGCIEHIAGTGGEYAISEITIHINKILPIRDQRMLAIHAVIENYNRSMSHDKVMELCGFIEDALDEIEALNA